LKDGRKISLLVEEGLRDSERLGTMDVWFYWGVDLASEEDGVPADGRGRTKSETRKPKSQRNPKSESEGWAADERSYLRSSQNGGSGYIVGTTMKTLIALVWATVIGATTGPGQDWAKSRLEKSPRHLEWVKVKQGNREVSCFVAYPEVKDKAPAVIVIHEIFGLTDWVRSVADQLAEAGYVAITPDLLSGAGPKGGGTEEFGGNEGVRKAIMSLPADQITADLDAVAQYVKGLPACNGKISVAGFCWGGGESFRYATNNKDLKAAFVFYGMPAKENALSKINSPVYGFYASNDARITTTVPQTTELMKSAGKTYVPVTYEGSGHGFMRAGEAPDANAANAQARKSAWARWREVLKNL
jgi:carboxymethylenebutenolidase